MSLSLILDIVMSFLLVGTMYFVLRLSDQISRFRNSRAEMDRLVRELNMAVDRAQNSILSLRETAQNSGDDLQKLMRQATELSDELQLMTESANSVATRLEGGVARSRVPTAEPMGMQDDIPAPRAVTRPAPLPEDSFPGFSIRDPEFDGRAGDDDLSSANDAGWGDDDDDLRSEAEKELFRALQQNKKSPRSVM